MTTYETASALNIPETLQIALVTADEAHYIKNPEAKRTINVREISEHADRLLFMTGTALENKVDEMVALIRILQPEIASEIRGMTYLSFVQRLFLEKIMKIQMQNVSLPETGDRWFEMLPYSRLGSVAGACIERDGW